MPPKLLSDDGKNIVIRPLAYCKEADIAEFSRLMEFPIIPCNLCGSQPNMQRQVVKEMLAEWDKKHPGRLESMFKAVTNVAPSQLADRELFDFAGLEAKQAALMEEEPPSVLPRGTSIIRPPVQWLGSARYIQFTLGFVRVLMKPAGI